MQAEPLEYELEQSCPQGFTRNDLELIFNPRQLDEFDTWMWGQTQGICDGRTGKWHGGGFWGNGEPICECHTDRDPNLLMEFEHLESECVDNPHGIVAYRYDVERYLEGGFRKAIWD